MALLSPSICSDEVCRALIIKVLWKCLNDSSIKVGLAVKGNVFDHLRDDNFRSGEVKDGVEGYWEEL